VGGKTTPLALGRGAPQVLWRVMDPYFCARHGWAGGLVSKHLRRSNGGDLIQLRTLFGHYGTNIICNLLLIARPLQIKRITFALIGRN
jgi:hypothetical protein